MVLFLFNVFRVDVSCRILYSFDSYLCVSCSGSITSIGEESTSLSAIVYLWICGFCSERIPLPLDAWDGLCYFLWYSLSLPCNYNFLYLFIFHLTHSFVIMNDELRQTSIQLILICIRSVKTCVIILIKYRKTWYNRPRHEGTYLLDLQTANTPTFRVYNWTIYCISSEY